MGQGALRVLRALLGRGAGETNRHTKWDAMNTVHSPVDQPRAQKESSFEIEARAIAEHHARFGKRAACKRDPKYDGNFQGPCSAGCCDWPFCVEGASKK